MPDVQYETLESGDKQNNYYSIERKLSNTNKDPKDRGTSDLRESKGETTLKIDSMLNRRKNNN